MDRRDIGGYIGGLDDRVVTIVEIGYEGKNVIDATGIPTVLISGMITLEGGVPTSTTGGRVIRDNAGCPPYTRSDIETFVVHRDRMRERLPECSLGTGILGICAVHPSWRHNAMVTGP